MATLARRFIPLQVSLLVPEAAPKPLLLPAPPPIEPGQREEVRQLRASLASSVAAKVISASELLRTLEKRRRDAVLPTTLEAFDALIGGGLPRGKIVEVAGRRSAGRFSIVLATLASSTGRGEAAALIDLGDNFDPQIAEANGVDLRRLLWIRPHTLRQAVMSAEMILATGFQLVVLDAGSHPIRGRRVPDAAWVRLARSAEGQGSVLLVSSPYPLAGTTPEVVVAAQTAHATWLGRGRSPRVLAGSEVEVTLTRHRHLRPGKKATLFFIASAALDVSDASGALAVSGALARSPQPAARGKGKGADEGAAVASQDLPSGISAIDHPDVASSAGRGLRAAGPIPAGPTPAVSIPPSAIDHPDLASPAGCGLRAAGCLSANPLQ